MDSNLNEAILSNNNFILSTDVPPPKMIAHTNRGTVEFEDSQFLAEDVPQPTMVSHKDMGTIIRAMGAKKGLKILEIGSREVTGKSDARKIFSEAEATYVGFDFYPGDNVDVVGDAHKLSSYFDENEKFDLIYSRACFEHFAMPWVVAEEINKLLKVGGYLFIETHFSFSSHERPWHFFQFSDMALKALFSPAMGFACIDAGASNPIVGRFSSLADEHLRGQFVTGLYCHSAFFGAKIKEVENFSWNSVSIDEIVDGTKYPAPR